MTEEFNLSEKFKDLREGAIQCSNDATVKERIEKWDWFLRHLDNIEEDVKEFIKRLKKVMYEYNGATEICEKIDKLAGSSLVDKEVKE